MHAICPSNPVVDITLQLWGSALCIFLDLPYSCPQHFLLNTTHFVASATHGCFHN